MPIYAKDVYGGGPHTLGLLLSAAGAGALLCDGVSRRTRRRSAGWGA